MEMVGIEEAANTLSRMDKIHANIEERFEAILSIMGKLRDLEMFMEENQQDA